MPDEYTYAGTPVLRNRFGITTPAAAHEIEVRASYQRLQEISAKPVPGCFDLTHLQDIHRALYRDVWDWAGELRHENRKTSDVPGLAACRPELLVKRAGEIFGPLAGAGHLRGLTIGGFADRLAFYWGEVSALHPFRDGNPRAQRVFFHELTLQAGWRIDWDRVNLIDLQQAGLLARFGHRVPLRDMWLDVVWGREDERWLD